MMYNMSLLYKNLLNHFHNLGWVITRLHHGGTLQDTPLATHQATHWATHLATLWATQQGANWATNQANHQAAQWKKH